MTNQDLFEQQYPSGDHGCDLQRPSMTNQDLFERQYPRITESSFYQKMEKTCRYHLSKFPCLKNIDEYEVLCEAIIRLKDKFLNEEIFPDVDRWIAKSIQYIVKEFYRREIKRRNYEAVSIDDENGERYYLSSVDKPIEVQEQYEFLYQALELMNESDRQLLKLRFFEGLSWKKIREIYAQNGDNVSEDSLRQKSHRAVEKLRKIWKSLPGNA
jgi:RNA polymerase sigma factor (sigma-70 family)